MAILVNSLQMMFSVERRFLMAAACVTCALLVARPAAAQSSDAPRNPIGFVVGADVSYDSNLFRQPSSAKLTSDTLGIAYVGLRIDTQQSLQRFQLDITETMRRYANTTSLNFDALDYRGAWLWQVGTRVTGTLSADRKESLAPFEDALNPGNNLRNVRINENRIFNLDAWAFDDWHLLLGINQSTQKSEQATEIDPDFKAAGYEAGVKYAVSSGSSLSAIRRSSSGDYLNQSGNLLLGTGYKQDESELKIIWIASGKSTLSGRLTWLDRTQDGAAQRNFSGLAGEFLYAWVPTGKLSMNLIAKRDIAPFQDITGSYIVSDTISFAPTWTITAKTVARLLAAHTTSNFAGAASVPAIGPPRRDRLNLIDIGVDWSPVNRLIFSAGLLHQVRDSNIPTYAFKDIIARITASYRF
jgi:exopolysaccharide biosynthesis operon protein EpsL